MSIFHRLTGIALAFGAPVFVVWLLTVAGGLQLYEGMSDLFHTLPKAVMMGLQIILFGWTFAFFFHLCCGIRHLFWDAGRFVTIKGMYVSGYIALAVSVVLTVLVWLNILGFFS